MWRGALQFRLDSGPGFLVRQNCWNVPGVGSQRLNCPERLASKCEQDALASSKCSNDIASCVLEFSRTHRFHRVVPRSSYFETILAIPMDDVNRARDQSLLRLPTRLPTRIGRPDRL